jgi:hypothetical protein
MRQVFLETLINHRRLYLQLCRLFVLHNTSRSGCPLVSGAADTVSQGLAPQFTVVNAHSCFVRPGGIMHQVFLRTLMCIRGLYLQKSQAFLLHNTGHRLPLGSGAADTWATQFTAVNAHGCLVRPGGIMRQVFLKTLIFVKGLYSQTVRPFCCIIRTADCPLLVGPLTSGQHRLLL